MGLLYPRSGLVTYIITLGCKFTMYRTRMHVVTTVLHMGHRNPIFRPFPN